MKKTLAILGALLCALFIPGALAHGHHGDGSFEEHDETALEGNWLADAQVEGASMGMPAGMYYPRNPLVEYADESFYYYPIGGVSYKVWSDYAPINMQMGDELTVRWTPTGTGHTAPITNYYPSVVYFGGYPMYQINNFWYNGEYLVLYYDGYGYPIGVSPTHKVYYFGPESYAYDPAYISLLDWLYDDIGYVSINYVSSPPFSIGYSYSSSMTATSSGYSISSGIVLG